VLQVRVYANEDDQTETSAGVVHSPDAKDIGSGTLRLRAERVEGAGGRVYLIVVRATDTGGNVGVAVATVVAPESASANHVNLVNSKAASARAYTLANNGAPPPGYFVVGDGPVIGPKQ
jgi:hypothetical protein